MAWCKNLTVSAAEIGRYHLRLENVLSQTTLERDARFRRCSLGEVRNGATFDVERPEKVPEPMDSVLQMRLSISARFSWHHFSQVCDLDL
jgi:hypothetical protein